MISLALAALALVYVSKDMVDVEPARPAATLCASASVSVKLRGLIPWVQCAEHETRNNPTAAASLAAFVRTMTGAHEHVRDYHAVFYKRERVRGRLARREVIQIKFRSPSSVYMKWIGSVHRGQEALYVRGWNDDKLRAHPGTFPDVTVDLDPRGRLAMRGNRHPITHAGLTYIVELISAEVERVEVEPSSVIEFVDHGVHERFGALVHCVEARFTAGFYAPHLQLCKYTETSLLSRITAWDEKDRLLEDYEFRNIKINTGLGRRAFAPTNPRYNF